MECLLCFRYWNMVSRTKGWMEEGDAKGGDGKPLGEKL